MEGGVMNARERLLLAVARTAHDASIETGFYFFEDEHVRRMAEEVGATAHDARQVTRELSDRYLIESDGGQLYKALPGLVLEYEERYDRPAFYAQNATRRAVLEAIADADRRGEPWVQFGGNGDNRPIDRPQMELFCAAGTLAWLGLARLDIEIPQSFCLSIQGDGTRLVEDERELDARLPTSATADTDAHEAVAADALGGLIWSCEEMLRRRGWENALVELARGDAKYAEGDWKGAVREYYMAVESGLKYRLGEDSAAGGEARALRKLASAAARAGVIPTNYDALFGLLDSIRSPVSHGAGPNPTPVEVGEAEALLLGNHARALLLYLGQRP
jgi:hypothetical protein